MTKPGNKYRKGSIVWSIMEGDWEDLTVAEIAEVLDTSENCVRTAMQRIRRETGYTIPYRREDRRSKQERQLREEPLPRRLNAMRKRRGLTALALAELCGLSKNVIFNYESGKTKPRMDSLVSLADFFDVSIDYLAGRTDSPQRLL